MSSKLIVDRNRWSRGERSCMYNNYTGKCCVLGFALNQLCSIQEIEYNSKSYPHAISATKLITNLAQKEVYNTLCDIAPNIVKINDDEEISEYDRERLLISIFRETMAVELVFKN